MAGSVGLVITGPLSKQPQVVLDRVTRAAVKELVELGEERLNKMLRPRPGGVFLTVAEAGKGQASTGHYRRSLDAKAQMLTGYIYDGDVIYGPWLEGTGRRNKTTRFKGYGSFRRTRDWLNKQAPRVLAEHGRRLARKLGGR